MTRALYYPTVDIANEDWLKTAILFWDEINTIVPESITNPYREVSTQYLSDEGILRPLQINPGMDLIENLTNDAYNYLKRYRVFLSEFRGNVPIHKEQLPYNIDAIYEEANNAIKKIQKETAEGIRKIFLAHKSEFDESMKKVEKQNNKIKKNPIIKNTRNSNYDDNWRFLDSGFANFYMTLLANKLAEENSIALLTDNSLSSNLADEARLSNQVTVKNNAETISLAQGLLSNLVIESIKINPNTSLEKVIDFKRRHKDELGIFRTNLTKLTQSVSKEKPVEAIRQEVQDIYQDEFLPTYNNFKKALNSSGIKWFADNFMKVSCFSVTATALPTALLGLSTPTAIIAGAGISLATSLVSYNAEKRKIIRENPNSYLLAIKKKL